MSATERMQQMSDAGFTQEEIGGWAANKTKELSEAGFGMGEIETYFGKPPFDEKPIHALVQGNLERAAQPETPGGPRKQVSGFLEAFDQGFGMSSASLLAKPPSTDLAPDAPRLSRVASHVGTLLGDIPAMMAGFAIGGANPITGTAGAFTLPAEIRKIMMYKYERGEVTSSAEFVDRLFGTSLDTIKNWVVGAATGAVGNAIGLAPVMMSTSAKNAATVGGELVTMHTVGKALEGKLPEPDEFLDTVIALGFLKGSTMMARKLRSIYEQTGVRPADLAKDAAKDPTILQDLASNKPIPDAYSKAISPEVLAAKEKVASRISVGEEHPKKTTWQDVYTQAVDELNPIREAVKRAEKPVVGEAGGTGPLATAQDPYRVARLSRGTFGKSAHFLEIATYDFKTYRNNGPALKDRLEPVKNDLQGLREYSVSKRAIEKEGQGFKTGVDLTAAHTVVSAGAKKYDTIHRSLVDYQDRLTAYLRDSGVLSAKTYEQMREVNKEFVPFYRVMNPGSEVSGGKAGGLKARQPIRKFKGSEREIVDPIESVIKNTYTYMALAERNAVGTTYVNMAKASGRPEDFIQKVPPTSKPITLRETEIQKLFDEFYSVTKQTSRTSTTTEKTTTTGTGETVEPPTKQLAIVTARVKEALKARGFHEGEAKQMINRVASGGKAGDHTTVEKVLTQIEKTEYVPELNIRLPNDAAEIWRTIQTPLKPNEIAVFEAGKRNVYTVDPDVAAAFKATDAESASLLLKIASIPAKTLRAGAITSPDFIARNLIRDQMSAFLLSKGGYVPIYDFVRAAMSLAKKDADFGNWLKSGGANAAMVSVDRRYMQEHLFNLSKETGLMDKAWNVAKSPYELLRIASELTENATRLGEFKRVAGDHTSKAALQEAGYASREVTLDFARIGSKMRAVNMIDAFSNVAIQGVDRVVRGFAENPGTMALKIAGAITAPSVLLWMANHDDPRWKEIPDWQRDLFWIVMTEDTIYRIPKPFELGVIFGSLPERILDAYFTDYPDAFKHFEDSTLSALLPSLVPNIAAPIIEQFSNRSIFTGSPIVPSHLEKLLPEYQYTDYTTETAKAIGGLIGAFPGVQDRAVRDENFIGATARALTAPALIENYVRSWSGGLGMYALQLADKALREAGVLPDPVMPASTLADLPVIKAFVVRYPSATAKSIQDFYDNYYASKKYFDTMMELASRGDMKASSLMDQHQSDLAQVDGIRETLTQQAQLIRLINKNPDLTPTDQRQLIDTMYFSMIDIAKGGNAMLRTLSAATKESHP